MIQLHNENAPNPPNTGWELLYLKNGEIQKEPLQKIINFLEHIQNKRDYHTMLDLGCGTGRHAILFAENGYAVYAADISREGLNIAKEKSRRRGIDNIIFLKSGLTRLPFSNMFFDTIVCTLVIDHGTKNEIAECIGEVYRILRKDGVLFVDFLSTNDSTYHKGTEIDPNTFLNSINEEPGIVHHYSTREEIEILMRGFSKVEISEKETVFYNRQAGWHSVCLLDVLAYK